MLGKVTFVGLSLLLLVTPIYSSPFNCGTSSETTITLFDLLSLLFDEEYQETALLKYDRVSDEWTTNCPEVGECLYGLDEGDEDICPSCYHGPGDVCGPWIGYCDATSDLVCEYTSDYASEGLCVDIDVYSHKKLGEVCGDYEGLCDEGLHCRFESEYYDGEAGMCVTNEEFFSGEDGDSCSERTGGCIDGLECNDGYFFSSTCGEPSNQTFTYLDLLFESEDGISEFEIIIEIEDESLLEDDEYLEELIYEIEEMMYLEALYEMEDEDVMAFFDEDVGSFGDFFSFETDYYWEDDDSYYYNGDSSYYGDDSYLDEQSQYDEEKVHVFDDDLLIDEERTFVEKDFHIM
jgi:hypothetical protein